MLLKYWTRDWRPFLEVLDPPLSSVADPGFQRGRGASCKGGGCQNIILAKYQQKLDQNEKQMDPGGASLGTPLDPPMLIVLGDGRVTVDG